MCCAATAHPTVFLFVSGLIYDPPLFRSGGFGGFKKKGTFGRGNVRKRAAQDDEDDKDESMPTSAAVVPAEKKKKTLALGGSTARDDKVRFDLYSRIHKVLD